jgi:hypothetical protein
VPLSSVYYSMYVLAVFTTTSHSCIRCVIRHQDMSPKRNVDDANGSNFLIRSHRRIVGANQSYIQYCGCARRQESIGSYSTIVDTPSPEQQNIWHCSAKSERRSITRGAKAARTTSFASPHVQLACTLVAARWTRWTRPDDR